MVDRDSIQQRIDALAQLERARELQASGDLPAARSAVSACLDILPDHPEALAMVDELGPGPTEAATADSFDLSDWLSEEKAHQHGDPTDQGDLRSQLRAAIRDGEHEKIISLGEAMLTIAGPNTLVYHEQVAASAEYLVDKNTPCALDHALGWADTWWRVCRDPQAKEIARDLKGRIASVGSREQRLRDALGGQRLGEVMEALHALTASGDRLSTSQQLIDQAETALKALRRDVAESKQALADNVPGRIDQACRLLENIIEAEPTAEHHALLRDLKQRERAAAALHQTVELQLDRGHLTPLEQACYRLRASGDHLSTSIHLLERAEATLAHLGKQLAANLEAYQRGLVNDFEQAVVALTAIRRIDPDHDLCARLGKMERQLARLEDLHHDIENQVSSTNILGLRQGLARLQGTHLRLQQTDKLVRRAERTIADAESRERRHRSIVLGITAGCAIAILLPVAWWLYSRSTWHGLLEQADDQNKLDAIVAFADNPVHAFYATSASLEAQRLEQALIQTEFDTAATNPDDAQRIAALNGFIAAHPEHDLATNAQQLIDQVGQEASEEAFTAARAIKDPAQRIAALTAYLADDANAAYAELAQAAINTAQTERDDAAWAQASSPNGDRAAKLTIYLNGDTVKGHAAEAREQLASISSAAAKAQQQAADDGAWQQANASTEPQARLTALEAYLGNEIYSAHRSEAERALSAAKTALDTQRWQATAASTSTTAEKLKRIQNYLSWDVDFRTHLVEARKRQTDLERILAREQWNAASAPGPISARTARLQEFLSKHPTSPHKADAELLLSQLQDKVDYDRYAKARSVLDPAGRVLALQAYLAGDGSLSNADKATAEIAKALDGLAALPPADMALLPPDVLVQLSPQARATLPQSVQLALPASSLATLPPAAQARLPISAFKDLSPAEQVRIARKPAWCQRAGLDAIGAWIECDLPRSAVLRLRLVVPGAVTLDEGLAALETPVWVSESEITQAQWRAIAGSHSSRDKGDDFPVLGVEYDRTERFLSRLSKRLELDDAQAPRLPTVAQWRFLSHSAGTGAAGLPETATPQAPETIDAQAMHSGTSKGSVHSVTALPADAWGLRGLYGNVSEWTQGGSALGGNFDLPATACGPNAKLAAVTDDDPRVGLRIVIPAR
jgi:hypothetical protein